MKILVLTVLGKKEKTEVEYKSNDNKDLKNLFNKIE